MNDRNFIVTNKVRYYIVDNFDDALMYHEIMSGSRPTILMYENGTYYEISFKRVAG